MKLQSRGGLTSAAPGPAYIDLSFKLHRTMKTSVQCLFHAERLVQAASSQLLEDRRFKHVFRPELLLHESQLKTSYHVGQPIVYQRRFGRIVVETDGLIQAAEREQPASTKSADESHLARAGRRGCLERSISKGRRNKSELSGTHSGESRYFVNFSSSL